MKSKKGIVLLCLIIFGAVLSVIFNFGADLKDCLSFFTKKEKKNFAGRTPECITEISASISHLHKSTLQFIHKSQ